MVCKTELNSLHVLYFLIDLVPGILFTSLQPDFHICVVFYVVFDLETKLYDLCLCELCSQMGFAVYAL